MNDGFKRWEVGPFASGASSKTGGHWRVLGLTHTWLPPMTNDSRHWQMMYELSIFDLLAFKWGDGRFQWAFFKLEFRFRNARWRFGEREEARQRRVWRRERAQLRDPKNAPSAFRVMGRFFGMKLQ